MHTETHQLMTLLAKPCSSRSTASIHAVVITDDALQHREIATLCGRGVVNTAATLSAGYPGCKTCAAKLTAEVAS